MDISSNVSYLVTSDTENYTETTASSAVSETTFRQLYSTQSVSPSTSQPETSFNFGRYNRFRAQISTELGSFGFTHMEKNFFS